MTLATVLFIIVMLHLAAGFGYVLYKLEFEEKKDQKNKQDKSTEKEK